MQHFPTIGKVLFFSQISPHFFIRNTEPHIRKHPMWGSVDTSLHATAKARIAGRE